MILKQHRYKQHSLHIYTLHKRNASRATSSQVNRFLMMLEPHCRYTVKLEHGPENCHDQTPPAILNADNVFYFRQLLKTKQQCFTMLYLDSYYHLNLQPPSQYVPKTIVFKPRWQHISKRNMTPFCLCKHIKDTYQRNSCAPSQRNNGNYRQQAPGELQRILKNTPPPPPPPHK